jgi:predicted molibdopterin-dependent oxidoreductase YjgC
MIVEGGLYTRDKAPNAKVFEALKKLEYLVVLDAYDSPLAEIADVVIPVAMNLEKDGTFTSFDRTVQRVRSAVPSVGDARPVSEIIAAIAETFGYDIAYSHPSQIMNEIAALVPDYQHVSYARLERGGIVTPAGSDGSEQVTVLQSPNGVPGQLTPEFIVAQA